MSSEYPRPIPATLRWSRSMAWILPVSVPVNTISRNSSENGSGPSFASGPSSPASRIHHPALRSVPNYFTSRAGSRTNRRRTTLPFGRDLTGGASKMTRPPWERWIKRRRLPRPKTRNLPRRPTDSSLVPARDSGGGMTVFRAENESGSAARRVAPARAAPIRSDSAWTSGSSGMSQSVGTAPLKGSGHRVDPFGMRRFLARVALVCAVTAGVLIPAQAAFAQFSDVPTTYWDYTQITYVAETNLWMQDYGPTVFNPTTKETRSLLCSALVKAYAPDQPIDPTITFPDLPTSDPYYPYANVCVKNDWIEPFNDGRWAGGSATPKSLVDRAIVLAMGNLDDAVAGLQNIHRLNGAKYTWANERGPYMQMAAWLGLHFDHSGSDEKLDLLSSTNMKRDEVAYTLWAAKTTTSWMISDAHMFDDITLGNDSASNKVNMIQYAIDQIGYPYIWAGEWNTKSPAGYCCGTQDQGGFDCSGFTWWVEKRYEENYNAAQYHPNYSGWNLHERSSYDMAAATAPKDQR